MSARLPHRLVAALVASVVLVGAGAPTPASAAPAALADPGDAALDWIEDELDDDSDGVLDTSGFPDYGLTIDALLALAAGGRGDDAVATASTAAVEAEVGGYVTSGEFGPQDRWAGAIAKTLLLAQVQGSDPTDFGGFDLEDELRDRMQPSGTDAGRFSDKSEFGDFSNGFGQALATMGLAATSGGVPEAALRFLLDQQCPSGGFRGDYTTTGGCTDDAVATVDATGFALMALTATTPTCATRRSVADAVAWLLDGQGDSGAFGGETGSNTNSTGLAAVALRSLGEDTAADRAAAFIAGLQLESGDDLGAIALNAAGEASAADGIQDPERDGFRRASTQGVLAFGLPGYAELVTGSIDPADLAPCAAPPAGGDASGDLSISSVDPGGTVTITAEGFQAGETVRATLHSTPVELGTTTADADGHVTMTVTIPRDVEPGDHEIRLLGLSSGTTVTLPLTVLGADDPRSLPATGGATGPLATTGVGMLAIGAAALLASRRRAAATGRASR